jgi:hypothetical protein
MVIWRSVQGREKREYENAEILADVNPLNIFVTHHHQFNQ